MAGFMNVLGSLVQNGLSGSNRSPLAGILGGSGGGLGNLIGGLGGQTTGQSGGQSSGGLGGALGDVLGNLSGNSNALGGLGALLGGGSAQGGTKGMGGAIGGGALAVLASLAVSALKKNGQQAAQTPAALYDSPTPEQQEEMDRDAKILVRAMINAAKADGHIDREEQQRILGKLSEDGLTAEEEQFFRDEAQRPLDLEGVIASAANRPETAAQIYAASLLAIDVDTVEEQQYMQDLARGLGLSAEVTQYIESTLKNR